MLMSQTHNGRVTEPATISALVYFFYFSVDLVALSELVDVFREQELQQGEHVMDVVEVIHGLTALYEKLEERSILVNVPLCVDMCLNWLLNVYDRWVEPLREASTFLRSCFFTWYLMILQRSL